MSQRRDAQKAKRQRTNGRGKMARYRSPAGIKAAMIAAIKAAMAAEKLAVEAATATETAGKEG